MTKEEIQRVLALSLEYYKSEVFGTDKESKKPSRERIDWIYDKMKGSSEIPNDLEEAADEYAEEHGFRVPYDGSDNFYDDVDVKASKEGFITGAKWNREKMMKDGLDAVKSGQSDKIEKTIAGVFVKYGMDKQREMMMKEAIEAVARPLDKEIWCDLGKFPELEDGDDIQIIIIKKED